MKRFLTAFALTLAPAAVLAQDAGGPILPGDAAFGLSRSAVTDTAHRIRAGAVLGTWQQEPFLQSMEFDNAAGPFSHSGNLLALDFGSSCTTGTPPGGEIYVLSTDGTDQRQFLTRFDDVEFDISACTRTGGLSVSPDNTKLALIGYDSGSLFIMNYTAGAPGSAAVSLNAEVPFFCPGATTQGTTWLDDDTVLCCILDPFFTPERFDLVTYRVSDGAITTVIDDITAVGTASRLTDVEYNPCIVDDTVYAIYSSFTAGVTTNTLTVVQKSTWTVTGQYTYNTSMNTGREIALGPDGLLYVAQFSGRIDTVDPAALANDTSVDYHISAITAASFVGLDVAGPCGACVPCDTNCDGSVNGFDIDPLVELLSGGGTPCSPCAGDVNGDGSVNGFDIDPFVDALQGAGC